MGKESAKVPFKMTPASDHQTQNYDYIGGGSKIKSEKSTWAKVNSKFELLLPKKKKQDVRSFSFAISSNRKNLVKLFLTERLILSL